MHAWKGHAVRFTKVSGQYAKPVLFSSREAALEFITDTEERNSHRVTALITSCVVLSKDAHEGMIAVLVAARKTLDKSPLDAPSLKGLREAMEGMLNDYELGAQ